MKFLTSEQVANGACRLDVPDGRVSTERPSKLRPPPIRRKTAARGFELMFRHVVMLLLFHATCYLLPNAIKPDRGNFAQAHQHLTLNPNVQKAPTFVKSMDLLNVMENTPVNKRIYTLEAVTETSDLNQDIRIVYAIEGTHLFALEDPSSGHVRVKSPIDREQTGDSLEFQVLATPHLFNWPGPQTRLNITVYILDENDNAPNFESVRLDRQSLAYSSSNRSLPAVIRLNVSEDTPIGSIVVDQIEAIDLDKASSSPLSATCLGCEPEFRLAANSMNALNDRLEWSIVLVQQLVHQPGNNQRPLNVIVSDGKFNSSLLFEVTIDDVQNKPPQFVSSTTCVVQEGAPIGKTILELEAVDGDALASDWARKRSSTAYAGRSILYDFYDPALGGQGSSRAYDFRLHPLTGKLQVADRLDRELYLEQSGVLSLQVRARELTIDVSQSAERAADGEFESMVSKLAPFVDPADNAAALAEINVIVLDVNDNPPRWLNSSEILQMSRAPVWHARLPNDRDYGRNYQILVRENSPAGSPLTNKNEMFVYDLDAGENAEFSIHLEDPFGLFDVEPKRVSGSSSVTLKLAAATPAGRAGTKALLDYENINERSYIVQLHAQETNTREQLRSKAQIQIKVLDVNDNAPEFRESAYVANIREDAQADRPVKMVQASDRDEVSRQLRYSLHGHSAYLFNIDSRTGLITVAKCEREQQSHAPLGATPSRRQTSGSQSSGSHNHNLAPPPTQRPCLDYESQRVHHLMVEASDGELSSKVPLQVFVEDASDNAPVFTLPIIDVVIEEGQERLEPPIRIEATDLDQTSTLTYSILEGNFEGFFALNNATGELQLTRPIRIPHDDLSIASSDAARLQPQQLQLNKMTLIVQASDGQHTTNGTIRIDILDANDNAPQFTHKLYERELLEGAQPGQSVLQVRAFDTDRGNNARVSYRIERGSHNQFEIDEATGEISVSREARPFEAQRRENYTIEVVASDHGLVSKSSSAMVLIKLVGVSQRAPEFEPKVQRVTVLENALNNTVIHRMAIREHNSNSNHNLNNNNNNNNLHHQSHSQLQVAGGAGQLALMFEPGPVEGLDKFGQPVVELERLETMLSVSSSTGEVVVASSLDHNFAAYINLTLYVSYRPLGWPYESNVATPAANLSGLEEIGAPAPVSESLVDQAQPSGAKSVGYLIVNVIDDNEHAPVFAAPWTPSQPELSFQMLEELPVGSILTQLVASDADSKISHFEITPPNEYFELSSSQTGLIVNKKLIDYDQLMRQHFLSPGAHRASGSNSTATTLPAGMATPPAGNNVIQFNVIVFDSGLRQLSAKAIVSVEILPINDNDCKFEHQLYEAKLRENSLPDTVVAQVRAIDLDFGDEHSSINYQLLGEHRDLFNIDSRTGVVTVSSRGSLGLDRERLANPLISLIVVGRDEPLRAPVAPARVRMSGGDGASQHHQSGGSRSCSTTLRVQVEDVNDNPPLFSQKVYEATLYDTDSFDAPLINLIVHDEDAKHNNNNNNNQQQQQQPTNSFKILSGNLNDSFNISSTGVIYATRPLNETWPQLARGNATSLPIELKVQVRQSTSGSGPMGAANAQAHLGSSSSHPLPSVFTDECLVRVTLQRINRFAPEWRFEANKPVGVEENLRPGSLVVQLKCFDRDQPTGNSTRYWIKENGLNVLETHEFRLDPASGNLITRVELDRERRDFYQLIVACEDNGRPQSLESITSLYIQVLDVDDNKPEFDLGAAARNQMGPQPVEAPTGRSTAAWIPPSCLFVIEEQQSKGLQVGELKAFDRDLEQANPMSYCLLEGNEFQEFVLDSQTGVLYTNKTLDREKQAHYELLVRAVNDGQTCDEHLVAHLAASSNQTGSSLRNTPKASAPDLSLLRVRVELQDINDNAPNFGRQIHRAGVHHRAAWGTLVTQVKALDPDHEINGTLSYKINEILLYKTSPMAQYGTSSAGSRGRFAQHSSSLQLMENSIQYQTAKPIKLVQLPFRIDQDGNVYTQQLLTQYQLMSMFVLQVEATELSEPWRTSSTKLEVYLYESSQQLRIKMNLNPRFIELYQHEVESLLSNATKYTAIISRARSYTSSSLQQQQQHDSHPTKSNVMHHNYSPKTASRLASYTNPMQKFATGPMLDLSQLSSANFAASSTSGETAPHQQVAVPWWQGFSESHESSSIQAIFVDNHRLVAPHLVLEKFDLTSGQLLQMPQLVDSSLSAARHNSQQESSQPGLAYPLIDHVALASSALASTGADFHHSNRAAGQFGLAGIDWLENPAVLFVCLTSMLVVIGWLICVVGCCCTSRIKDHIIKGALDKLARQQALQAKINERVLAATNASQQQAAAATYPVNHLDQQDFVQAQSGGFMSSFDATKGCVNNNYENMSILQRALEAGEFFDPNYTTLTGAGDTNNNLHHHNLNLAAAHYYDASELENEQNGAGDHLGGQPVENSVVSLSLDDEDEEDQSEQQPHQTACDNFDLTSDGQLANGSKFKPKLIHTNGLNGMVSSHSRLRQQIPEAK